MNDIERFARGDTDATALADGVAQDAVMPAKHPAVDMDDVAGIGGCGLQLCDDVGILALRHEADVLTVLLGGYNEAHLFSHGSYVRLGQTAKGKAQVVDLRLRGGKQEIALVAIGIDRTIQGAMGAVGP